MNIIVITMCNNFINLKFYILKLQLLLIKQHL